MSFGQSMKKCREMRGMTQAQLAQVLGYKNKASIGKIENGDADVPLSKALDIADALGVDIMVLIHGIDRTSEFYPYLTHAEEWQLKAVRNILGMPEKNSVTESTKAIG